MHCESTQSWLTHMKKIRESKCHEIIIRQIRPEAYMIPNNTKFPPLYESSPHAPVPAPTYYNSLEGVRTICSHICSHSLK